jgi:hypothetical protein
VRYDLLHFAVCAIIAHYRLNRPNPTWKTSMHRILKGHGAIVALILVALASAPTTASAISADLAKKCRAMEIKAHPPTRPGVKKGDAEAERAFFASCITNGGKGADDEPSKDATPPAK